MLGDKKLTIYLFIFLISMSFISPVSAQITSGNVECWGYNGYGRSNPYNGGDATQVSAGGWHTCILKSNGNVECWGLNYYGQSNPYNGGDAIQVSAGSWAHTCILKSNGNVECWGYNEYGQSNSYNGGDATQVSPGAYHTCILKSNGNVECWGRNDYDQSNPYNGGDATQVSACSRYHTCILKSNGNVACWGRNYEGQSNPYNGGDATQVSAGWAHTCILKSNGNVECWGYNEYGQSNPYNGGDAIQVSAGAYHTCALKVEHCDNELKDYDETDIDCGGSCQKCSDEKSCLIDSDCQSNYCNPNKICETMIDISMDSSDISFAKRDNKINISAIIKNNKSPANNVEINFMDTYNNNLVKETTINIGSIPAKSFKPASINWDLEENHVVYVIIDPNNKIKESDKSNNNAHKEYVGSLKYYVEADVPPSKASDEIENYIKNGIKDVVIVDNVEEADIKVLIGRHNPLIMWHFATLEDFGWGFYGGAIKFQDKTCNKPYCGIVGDIVEDGKKEIYIEANDIDGFIAASKEFIEKQDSFKTTGGVIFLDEENEDAIAVYDYLHTDENLPHYKKDNDEFKGIVGKALEGEKYTVVDSNITLGDKKLRLRNLKPANGINFKEFKDRDGLPVVMGGGLWSDITAWEGLGTDLSDGGFDVYLVEITGGPGMECDTCEDYTYEFLTEDVYPAYIGKVKSLSGKSKIKYVGHSNGARVALDSLTEGKANPDDVDTLVLVGVPGAFSELSYFADIVNKSGGDAIERMRNNGLGHVTFSRVSHEVGTLEWDFLAFVSLFKEKNKISLNLFDKYYYWINSNNDPQPGDELPLDYFTLLYGTDGFLFSKTNDYIVPVKDELSIFVNINSGNKVIKDIPTRHIGMPNQNEVQTYVRKSLDKSIYK